MSPERHRKKEIPTQECVVFALHRDGKFLLERRPPNDNEFSGLLIVPGGKCEGDETPRETLKREVDEELGLTGVFQAQYLGSYGNKSSNGNKYFSMAYLVTGFRGEISNLEPEKGVHVWLPYDEAKREIRLAATKYVLFLANRKLNEVRPQRD